MTIMQLSLGTLAVGLQGIALLGCVQALLGAAMFGRFRASLDNARLRHATLADADLPPITVLKPLYGDEPMLEQALGSFIAQDYPTLQVIFGVQSASDPAIAAVQRLRQMFPGSDLRLVIDTTLHGPNRKIGNLINMLPHATHDLLVISDADIHVAPDYLRQVAASFANPEVGLVTTIYHGIPASRSLPRRLAAGQINHNFLPGVLLSRLLGRQDCLGSTMALHRHTLEAIGGLSMLSEHVADDSVLGKLVRRQGRSIEIAPSLTATTVADRTASDLFLHELRWGRTVRAVEPLGYALSAVQFPLFWATLALVAAPQAAWNWVAFAMIWGLRGLVAARIDRLIVLIGCGKDPWQGVRTVPLLLLPLRDWISAVIMIASFTGSRVSWRGQTLNVVASPAPGSSPPILVPAHRTAVARIAHQTLAQGD